ncbi:MAG: exodeoxyribonuclease V subunit gamma, partial [Cyanobacteriota bacterium]|nr:exodeoxyribonuclease V subunit gamma [Cyanobacteriota bacterium]
MLTIYRSNRAEWLARVLAEQLRLAPPGLFDSVDVVVNTWPTSRWLGEQLASVNGISALVRFPFPGSRLRQLVRMILGIDSDAEDPWRASRLVWPLLDLLPQLLETEEAAPLREWVNRQPSRQGHLNRVQWQLARSIADAFDDYALYRPKLIHQWLEGS